MALTTTPKEQGKADSKDITGKDLITLPEGWLWMQLQKLVKNPKADIVDGPFGSDLKASEYVDAGIPIIRLQNIDRNHFIAKNIRFISPNKAKELQRHSFKKGDIVITKLGDPLGEACIIPDEFETGIIVADVVRVIPDEKLVNKKYLTYAINSQCVIEQFEPLIKGSTRPRVNLSNIRELNIPVAPLNVQERIVARLEELLSDLEAGVQALQHVRAGLKRYKASVLKAASEGMLIESRGAENRDSDLPKGWQWATVEELANDERYSLSIGPFGSNLKVVDYRDEGVPLVFVRNIRTANFDETHYITKEKAEELRAHQISGGDILITKMGEPPGDACLYPESRPNAVITADCIKWRVSPTRADKHFIVHIINSPIMQKQIQKITRGVAQKKVSLERFRRLSVPLPPLEEQQRIVAEVERRLESARAVEAAAQAGLKRAARLRQAVLRAAFKGKLI